MALYEIVSMSDRYTMREGDFKIAAVCCLLLGEGQYALKPLDPDADHGGQRMPVFANMRWVEDVLGITDLNAYITANRLRIAGCMDTVLVGDRQAYEDFVNHFLDPSKRAEYDRMWHDRHRTSLNDIGGRARAWAEQMRTAAGVPRDLPPPKQIFSS